MFSRSISSFFNLFLKVRRAEVKIVVETHGDFIETLSLEKICFYNVVQKLFYIMANIIGKSNIIRAVSFPTEQQVLDIDSSKVL